MLHARRSSWWRALAYAASFGCGASETAPSNASGALPSHLEDRAGEGNVGSTHKGCLMMPCDAGGGSLGGSCADAETLRPADMARRLVMDRMGTSRYASDTSQSTFGSCANETAGPDVWYELDLRVASAAFDIHALVDASFDAVIDLRRGPCGDTVSLQCDRASSVGRPGSSLAARLDPDMYWLVVDGAEATSQGEFRLQVELDPRADCAEPPSNTSCETALELEPLERQSVLLDEACLESVSDDLHSYYSLDLTAEAHPVRAAISVWTLSAPEVQTLTLYRSEASGMTCDALVNESFLSSATPYKTNAELDSLLPPGHYVVEFDARDVEPSDHAVLSVQLDRDACREGPTGNGCEQAIDIDPSIASQVIDGSTLCNTNQLTLEPCARAGEEDAPDQFYRLDLRGAAGPTRARLTVLVDGLNFLPLLYVLKGDAAGGCGPALFCDDRIDFDEGPPFASLILEPEVYFVGVDGAEAGSAGTYRLLVELEPDEPSACVDVSIDDCMFANAQGLDCCVGWTPLCTEIVAACGLAPAAQACVCDADADCCGAGFADAECSAVQAACGYLCPEFSPSEFSCLSAFP
jgi:hypothetical protein